MKAGESVSIKQPGLWIGLGVLWIALVVFLSVGAFNMPQLSSSIGDKVNHAIAYGFLMIWFGQIFHSNRRRIWLAVGLIGLGIAMELIQGMLPHRWFDPLDGLANTVGVLLGMVVLICGADNLFYWVEQRLASRKV